MNRNDSKVTIGIQDAKSNVFRLTETILREAFSGFDLYGNGLKCGNVVINVDFSGTGKHCTADIIDPRTVRSKDTSNAKIACFPFSGIIRGIAEGNIDIGFVDRNNWMEWQSCTAEITKPKKIADRDLGFVFRTLSIGISQSFISTLPEDTRRSEIVLRALERARDEEVPLFTPCPLLTKRYLENNALPVPPIIREEDDAVVRGNLCDALVISDIADSPLTLRANGFEAMATISESNLILVANMAAGNSPKRPVMDKILSRLDEIEKNKSRMAREFNDFLAYEPL